MQEEPFSLKEPMHVEAGQPLSIKHAQPNGDATSGAEEDGERAHAQPHLLSLSSLVILIFFEVSGGPFGTEDAVSSGGALLTILGFLILPWVWSVPEALITAECATMFPENSGYVAWVTAAYGPFWGFQEGMWSWLSGVVDNSLYPAMLAANLQLFVPVLGVEGWPRSLFVIVVALMLSLMNYRGLTVVGNSMVASAIAIVVPFVLLVVLSVPHIKPVNWLEYKEEEVDWGTFINVMFWNLNYWDCVSTLAGEVRNPGKNFPRALLMAVILVVAMYLLPTMAALGVSSSADPAAGWGMGYYCQVAEKVGGKWLAVFVIIAAAFSQVGQYQAEMASDSYQLQGMAERGFLPLVMAKKSKHGTPTLGIILSSCSVLALAWFSFMEIVELLNGIYCLAELLEFAAFIQLRVSRPDLERPYRIPLPTWGLVLMLSPALCLLLFVLLLPFWQLKVLNMVVTLVAMCGSIATYFLLQEARKRKWCAFNPLRFDFDLQAPGVLPSWAYEQVDSMNTGNGNHDSCVDEHGVPQPLHGKRGKQGDGGQLEVEMKGHLGQHHSSADRNALFDPSTEQSPLLRPTAPAHFELEEEDDRDEEAQEGPAPAPSSPGPVSLDADIATNEIS